MTDKYDRTRSDDEQDEARFEDWNERTKGGNVQNLKKKIVETMAYSLNQYHMDALAKVPTELDPYIDPILQAFSAELDKIQIEIGQLDHHNILDKVDKIIDKARRELGNG